MKTIVKSFALSLALCAAAGATAQTKSAAPMRMTDSVLLSETTDGNYMVRRYLVKKHGDADYSVRYLINAAKLSATLDGNTKQLADLNAFMEGLMKDSLKHVRSAVITGYASPDGPMNNNEMLAKKRAMDFKAYVDKKYGFSTKYDVKTEWVADDWEMARALVKEWPVPEKAKVLEVIDGKWTSAQKEMALKKMPPAVWNYMKANILPPLRRVELTINYGDGMVVEQRMMIPKPAPAPQPAPEPCCPEVVVDESISGIIVEMPDSKSDFEKMTREERREMLKAEKMAQKEAKIADKLARKEAKDAAKIAKKAEKEARKMEKAAAKAAKKSYKNLEKGMK